jgi:flavin reductase (DIM6/NTAB) family NADH-FMN oxidoreductase RutF
MMQHLVSIDCDQPIWDRFFTVFPLVLVGTREPNGEYDLAPKHMAMPMSWQNFYGFVCAPHHRTYQNILREKVFTVSYPKPTQLVLASLAAAPRYEDDSKASLKALATLPARVINGVFVEDAYLFLECALDRVVDGFGVNSLITGRVVAAHVEEAALRSSDRDDQEIIYHTPLLAYLAPGRTATIRESYSFPFPKDFKR